MDISSMDTKGNTGRRRFLTLGGLVLSGTAGCLRLTGSETTPTSTSSGGAQSATPPTSTLSTSYPPLEIELATEIEFSGTNSSPGTKFAAVDDSRIAAVGGKNVKIVDTNQIAVERSVPIPNVSNFGSHGIVSHDGGVYAAVGGSSNAQIIKISPESGEVWRFEEEAFGPNVLRNIGGPVITNSVVAVAVWTTDNREGEADGRIYLLDIESGEPIVSPDALITENTGSTSQIAAGAGFVILRGSDGLYFYDVAAREYVGNTRGYAGEEMRVRDGILYTGKAAFDVPTREQLWENSGSPASIGTTIIDDRIYYGTPISCVSLEDGTLRWTYEPNGTVRGVATAGDGDVWAGTFRNTKPGYLYRIDAEDGSVLGASEFPPTDDSPISEPYGLIRHGERLFAGSFDSLVAYDVHS